MLSLEQLKQSKINPLVAREAYLQAEKRLSDVLDTKKSVEQKASNLFSAYVTVALALFGIGGAIFKDHALWPLFFRSRDPRRLHQSGLRVNIRLMFHAMVTRLHSPRTLSSPRSKNWRNPSTDLMMPNTGSGVCLRRA